MFGKTKFTNESNAGCQEQWRWVLGECLRTLAGRGRRLQERVCYAGLTRSFKELFFHLKPLPLVLGDTEHPSVPAPPTTCLCRPPLLLVVRLCVVMHLGSSFLRTQPAARPRDSPRYKFPHLCFLCLQPPLSFLTFCVIHSCTSAFLGTEDSDPFHVDVI